MNVLVGKQRAPAQPPSDLVDGTPPELERLCLQLLAIEPAERPGAEQILEVLARGDQPGRAWSAPTLVPARFVGRDAELARLREAVASTRAGAPALVLVTGRSGMGKTALVQRFTDELRTRADVLVLSGRCYEHERVPYAGLDAVVDELGRWLMQLDDTEVTRLLPAGAQDLARLFPVLRGVRAIDAAPRTQRAAPEPRQARRNAALALRGLLGGIARERSLVVHVDDLQWGDSDDASLLEDLLTPPDAPPLALICGFRDDAESSAAIAATSSLGERTRMRTLRVPVERLSEPEARELIAATLGGSAPAVVEAIAREAQGEPIFIAELIRWHKERHEADADARVEAASVEQVTQARVARLPDEARTLLELLAVANAPLEHRVAEAASGLGARYRGAEARLRAGRLVRSHGGERGVVETFHGRIRAAVVAALPDERRRQWHLSLAEALEARGAPDAETLVSHFLEAGARDAARRHVVAAADAAAQGLAFLRAARLYRLAIDLGAGDRAELLRRTGDALAAAGRGALAGDAYREAAALHEGEAARELRRLAAELYLKSGRETEGIALLRGVLSELEIPWPASTIAAVGSLLLGRARLLAELELPWRRFGPREWTDRLTRAPRNTPAAGELARVDACFTATMGLSMIDVLRAADFGVRQLRLSIEAGEPVRLCRALAFEAGNQAAVSDGPSRRARRLVRAAQELAGRLDDPHALGLAQLASGVVRFFEADWRRAERDLAEAARTFREQCRAVAWELTSAQVWSLDCLILAGELAEAARRVPQALKQAREHEDRYALVNLIYPECIAHIVRDDVAAAAAAADAEHGLASSYAAGYWGALISRISIDRYRGDGRGALMTVEQGWARLEASQILRASMVRVFSVFERALCAIAAAGSSDRAALLERAERLAARLSRERAPQAAPMSRHVAAAVAAARGQRSAALAELGAAEAGFDGLEMAYLAACARFRRGELLGGDAGAALVTRARAYFSAQGVVNPERCVAMSAPGWG